jgi:hypothetical protein
VVLAIRPTLLFHVTLITVGLLPPYQNAYGRYFRKVLAQLPIFSGIPNRSFRCPVLLPGNPPKADLASPVSVHVDLRQKLLPQIPISDKPAGGIALIASHPRFNELRDTPD